MNSLKYTVIQGEVYHSATKSVASHTHTDTWQIKERK